MEDVVGCCGRMRGLTSAEPGTRCGFCRVPAKQAVRQECFQVACLSCRGILAVKKVKGRERDGVASIDFDLVRDMTIADTIRRSIDVCAIV